MGVYILLFILSLEAGLIIGWQITVWKIGNLVNVESAAHEATKERFAEFRDLMGKEVTELRSENKQLRKQLESR